MNNYECLYTKINQNELKWNQTPKTERNIRFAEQNTHFKYHEKNICIIYCFFFSFFLLLHVFSRK